MYNLKSVFGLPFFCFPKLILFKNTVTVSYIARLEEIKSIQSNRSVKKVECYGWIKLFLSWCFMSVKKYFVSVVQGY